MMKLISLLLTAAALFGGISRSPSEDGGATCSSHPCTYSVTCSGSCVASEIQTCLTEAWLGDTIELQAGQTWDISSTLTIYRKTSGSGYLTLRSSTSDSLLPASDQRITPAYIPLLPTLRLTADTILLQVEQTTNAVEQYIFLGLHFTVQAGVARTNDMLRLWDATNHTDPSYTPNNIWFDRCVFLPAPVSTAKSALRLGVRNGVVKNSYFDQIKTQADSQAISFANSPGPVTTNNNYMSAPGENIMVGGLVPTIANLSPLDLDFYHNYFHKDPALLKYEAWAASTWVRAGKIISYGGSNYICSTSGVTGSSAPAFPASACASPPTCSGGCCVTDGTAVWQKNPFGSSPKWVVKNLFEFKFMGRSKVMYNGLDGSWTDGQTGYGFSFKPESQCSLCWTPETKNLEIAYNVVRNTNTPFLLSGKGDDGGGVTSNWYVHNNLAYQTNYTNLPGVSHLGSEGLAFQHNTVEIPTNNNTGWLLSSTFVASTVTIRDNLIQRGAYGIKKSSVAEGTASINSAYTTSTVTNNVIPGINTGNYPSGNFNTAWASVGFTATSSGNYRLKNGSTYRLAGPTGRDLGADTRMLPQIRGLTVIPAATTALMLWQTTAPAGENACVVEISAARDFATYTADMDPATYTRPDSSDHDRNIKGSTARMVVLGANAALTPSTTYYYRLHCGGAWESGSFATTATASGTTGWSVLRRQALAAGADIAVEWGYSYSRAAGTITGGGTVVASCAAGQLCAAAITSDRGRIVYYRVTVRDASTAAIRVLPVEAKIL